jgi:hypothetical protein
MAKDAFSGCFDLRLSRLAGMRAALSMARVRVYLSPDIMETKPTHYLNFF